MGCVAQQCDPRHPDRRLDRVAVRADLAALHGRTDNGFLIPTEIVLILIAIPSILSNTYAGIDNVQPSVRDAATGVGMTGSEVLWQVELPNSLPLIFSGFRSATLQVIATATIAAYFPLGGLGRFIYDGYAQQDFSQMVGGGILVAVLAVVIDLVLAGVRRLAVSRGVSGHFSTRGMQGGGALATVTGEPEQVIDPLRPAEAESAHAV